MYTEYKRTNTTPTSRSQHVRNAIRYLLCLLILETCSLVHAKLKTYKRGI